jgi:hypothetical protein
MRFMATSAKVKWQPPVALAFALIGLIAATCAVSQLPASLHLHHDETGLADSHSQFSRALGSPARLPERTRNEWSRAQDPRQDSTKVRPVLTQAALFCPSPGLLHFSIVSEVKTFPVGSALAHIWHRGPPSSLLA